MAVFDTDPSDRFEQISLLPNPNEAVVCLAELREMPQETIDFFAPVVRFQHVIADEIIQPMNVFDGHRLVEHLHRFRLHTSDFAEPALELLKRASRTHPAALQNLEHALR